MCNCRKHWMSECFHQGSTFETVQNVRGLCLKGGGTKRMYA